MKTYQIYLFTQDNCAPCSALKDYIATECTDAEQAEIDLVSFRAARPSQPYATGPRTALAEELDVTQTPTLVVVHEEVACDYDPDMGYEFCDPKEVVVEKIVGNKAIRESLSATLDAYTYAHPE